MPQEQYDSLMSYTEKNNLSFNTAMIELMDIGLQSKVSGKSGRAVYFNDISCLEEYTKEPLHSQTQCVKQMISRIFYDNQNLNLLI